MIDREVLAHDLNILSKNFIKVLEVDLNEGTFYKVKVSEDEEPQTIYIHEWMRDFAKENIHPDDVENFISFFNFWALKIGIENNWLQTTFYRRKFKDGYKYVSMDIVPLDTYTVEDSKVILVVRDVQSYIDTYIKQMGDKK